MFFKRLNTYTCDLISSLTRTPSEDSCAGPIWHQFAIDNPQLYEKKTSGVWSSVRVGTGCCVCMKLRKHLTNMKYNIEHLYVL